MQYEENWATYVSTEEDKPVLVQVDLARVELAPIANLPYLAYLTVDTKDREAGLLPAEATLATMTSLDEAIVTAFADYQGIVPVGISSSEGVYTYFFYVDSQEGWGDRLATVLDGFPEFEWDCGSKKDEEWECYFEYLYPNIFEMQVIYDLDVLQQLEDSGDDASRPRAVKHWVILSTAQDCAEFCEQVQQAGYTLIGVEEELYDEAQGKQIAEGLGEGEIVPEGTFEVHFEHTIAPLHISDYTLDLVHLAINCQGEYDGWETEIFGEGSEEE